MKLLFDQNLSPKLVGHLGDIFPGSSHVLTFNLDSAEDDEIWEFARIREYAIVTKDVDYNNLGVLRGFPPKVLWLLLGNCTTSEIASVFRHRYAEIELFEKDTSTGTLLLRS